MNYRLASVSSLWPDRVRFGNVNVPDDLAAIALFNKTWADSPDLIRAELRRGDSVLAGGARGGWRHLAEPAPTPAPVAVPRRQKPSRATRRFTEHRGGA